MKAVFYEIREWGLVEVDRRDIPHVSIYKVLQRNQTQVVANVGQNTAPMSASRVEKTYQICGYLPTGEAIFIQI